MQQLKGKAHHPLITSNSYWANGDPATLNETSLIQALKVHFIQVRETAFYETQTFKNT